MATRIISRRTDTCPACGGVADYEEMTEDVPMYSGEIDDDGFPGIETVTLSPGFWVGCRTCDWSEGEPPQY